MCGRYIVVEQDDLETRFDARFRDSSFTPDTIWLPVRSYR